MFLTDIAAVFSCSLVLRCVNMNTYLCFKLCILLSDDGVYDRNLRFSFCY